jgi:hypothetical protein
MLQKITLYTTIISSITALLSFLFTKRFQIAHLILILLGGDSIIYYLFVPKSNWINDLLEYLFYCVTVFWITEASNFSKQIKIALYILSIIFIIFSVWSYHNSHYISYELLLVINYFILILFHLYSEIFNTKINCKRPKQYYFLLFGCFTYNIASGLLYSIKCFDSKNGPIYMQLNLILVILSSIIWSISLFLNANK